MMLNRSLLNLSIMLVALSAVCLAQVSTGTISGSVRDSSGGAIVGAKVEITQLATTEKRQTVTNDRGEFNAPYLRVTQINILTPADTLSAETQIVVSNNGAASAQFTALAQPPSPSFFVFSDGMHVAAIHLDGTLVGPTSFSAPGYSFSPAKPGETISVYANGFGPTSTPVVAGSTTQGGTLSSFPAITVAGRNATVQFAGLVSPGLFQLNLIVPDAVPQGDQTIKATFGGTVTQSGTLLTIHP